MKRLTQTITATLLLAMNTMTATTTTTTTTTTAASAASTNNSSNNNHISTYAKTAEQFIVANPLEKVHLHMDNTSYFMGDTLWFKAYAVNAAQLKPTEESEILHVELLNPEGVVVRTQKYRLTKGVCDGSIVLDKELLSGFFEVRAYTKAMLNFGDQNYFTRVFPIFEGTQQNPAILDRKRTVGFMTTNKSSKEVKQKEKELKKAPHYNVKFYPEGGNLISGVTSKVAFQITNSEGQTVDDVQCTIYENKSRITSSISTHRGIGTFEITPNTYSRYYLKIDGYYERSLLPDSPHMDTTYYLNIDGEYERSAMSDIMIVWKDKKMEYDLPSIYLDGCMANVDCLSENNEVIIDVISTYEDSIGVVIIGRNGIADIGYVIDKKRLSIATDDLSEGVNQVVLYDSKGVQLASRLFFVRNDTLPKLKIKAARDGANTPHSRQEINFEVMDELGAGVSTDFSLSIYDHTALYGTSASANIYTSLLLSSEIRGYIPNSDYYFESDDKQHRHNLDLIMMVHGWSRYKWDEMSGVTAKENIYEYEKGLALYGQVYEHYWEWRLFSKEFYQPNDSGAFPKVHTKEKPIPTNKLRPYTEQFYIHYKAKVDNTINKSSSLIIAPTKIESNEDDNRFHIDIPDFKGSLNLFAAVKQTAPYVRDSKVIYIASSEYKPKERLYDLDETRLSAQVIKNKMFNYPSLKVRYYNRGHFSSFYHNYRISIYEPNVNTPITSIDNYWEYYDLEYIDKNMNYDIPGVVDLINNTLTSTNELLYYNKMPYGTVCYLSTLVEKRLDHGISNEYITTPLKYESITVTYYPFREEINFSRKKFNFVIDSTIIHTSLEKRMEVYNKYKDHELFNIFKIPNKWEEPVQTSLNRCPDYVVEYIGRKVTSPVVPSKPYRSLLDRVIVFQGFEEEIREFYSPDYSTMTPPASGDHRRTLYWNPNVRSDTEGNATVTFYNNSMGGSYTIDAQTITSDGQIGSTVK